MSTPFFGTLFLIPLAVLHQSARSRLIASALAVLREGRSVTVIAFPQSEAVAIARQICVLAKAESIPCRNLKGTDRNAPAIWTRGYGQANTIDRSMPVELRPVTFIDLSASFEKGCVREPRVRWVAG